MWNGVFATILRYKQRYQTRLFLRGLSTCDLYKSRKTLFTFKMSDHPKTLNNYCDEANQSQVATASHADLTQDEDNQNNSTETSPKQLSKRAMKRMKRFRERLEKSDERKAKKKKKNSYLPEIDLTKETSYYFENGLRKVYPYTFTFSTYAKGRWVGRKLLEVFCHEFKHYPEKVFKEKLQSGQVSVNNAVVDVDYVIKIHDHITHVAHRHEVPVTADPIEVLHDGDDILVINKPSSVPCHPCGCFRHNSVTFILSREHGYKNIKFVHRLDRLTSGLLILAKNIEKAAEISRQVAGRQLQKEYICRVEGNFPSGAIECHKPIGLLSHKLGIQYVTDSGKPAWTTFERISYNGKSSVVKCFPHTGRTHQIRVHLQYLGYPIINDVLYNSDCWGPQKGKGGDFGKDAEEVVALIMKNHDKMKYVIPDYKDLDLISDLANKDDNVNRLDEQNNTDNNEGSNLDGNTPEKMSESPASHCDNKSQICNPGHSEFKEDSILMMPQDNSKTVDRPSFDPSKMTFDPTCLDCQRQFKDPKPEELIMYLHALRYKGPDWEFSTPLPYWAADDWKE